MQSDIGNQSEGEDSDPGSLFSKTKMLTTILSPVSVPYHRYTSLLCLVGGTRVLQFHNVIMSSFCEWGHSLWIDLSTSKVSWRSLGIIP